MTTLFLDAKPEAKPLRALLYLATANSTWDRRRLYRTNTGARRAGGDTKDRGQRLSSSPVALATRQLRICTYQPECSIVIGPGSGTVRDHMAGHPIKLHRPARRVEKSRRILRGATMLVQRPGNSGGGKKSGLLAGGSGWGTRTRT
jgi:hypothetical protein